MTNLPPIPPRIARLPRSKGGHPVPWFVATIDGEPDFRVVGENKIQDAVWFGKCWLCGDKLGTNVAFVIGPMCAVNRVSAEPPSHRDCAIFAVRACPFLTRPKMRRRDTRIPDGTVPPDGIMIDRNPGVALVWITRKWHRIPRHLLFDVGQPTETLWYAEGRPATRAEALASIDSGLPTLRAAAENDPNPAASLAALDRQHTEALKLLPAAGQP